MIARRADLRAVRLGLEAEAHLSADLAAQRLEMDVVGGVRDRRVERPVGGTRGIAVGRLDVVGEGSVDRFEVVAGASLGGRTRDERLEEAPEVEQRLERLPARYERAPDHLGRRRPQLVRTYAPPWRPRWMST